MLRILGFKVLLSLTAQEHAKEKGIWQHSMSIKILRNVSCSNQPCIELLDCSSMVVMIFLTWNLPLVSHEEQAELT